MPDSPTDTITAEVRVWCGDDLVYSLPACNLTKVVVEPIETDPARHHHDGIYVEPGSDGSVGVHVPDYNGGPALDEHFESRADPDAVAEAASATTTTAPSMHQFTVCGVWLRNWPVVAAVYPGHQAALDSDAGGRMPERWAAHVEAATVEAAEQAALRKITALNEL